MKKIGLVGGTGPESTLMYYRELNGRIDALTRSAQMPEIAIESVNFRRAWELVSAGNYEALTDYLAEKIEMLSRSGCEVISLTAATMHVVYDGLVRKTGIRPVSIPEAVCAEARRRGYRKVGLLGTIFTMEQDFMKSAFVRSGMEVAVPGKADRELIAKRILEELELGIVKEETLGEFTRIIEGMRDEQGIEAIILGCTELPLLLNPGNCPVDCLDSVEIHLQTLIRLTMD